MQSTSVLALMTAFFAVGDAASVPELALVTPNANIESAGVLRDGVLTVTLEAKTSAWQMDGPTHPARRIAAFSEMGKAPLLPGPFVRVPAGTAMRFAVRNSLSRPLTFFLPGPAGGSRDPVAEDSVIIAPGATGRLTMRATRPGNYLYRATTPTVASDQLLMEGLLAGGLVVDTAGAHGRPHDRVFIIMMATDSAGEANASTDNIITGNARQTFVLNGRSWPHTDRVSATVGDSLHWRIINASAEVHPMHLHGFYYRVDALTGPQVESEGQGLPGRMVVTERMSPFSAMSMTWSPDRPGNWIFHCHFALHLTPDSLSAEPDDHGLMGMIGLVMGITVADRPGARAAVAPIPARHVRVVAVVDKGFPDSVPSMRFVIEERGQRIEAGVGHSPPLELVRGQPVAITVVNHLAEGTSVHWHGIELESYNDGVGGVSGTANRVAPVIAPGDSFVAQMTPPRSGTFIYHAHMDEVRQQQAGLAGALIVRDAGAVRGPDDHVFFLRGSRDPNAPSPLDVNGEANPDTIVLRVGRPARLRFISLAMFNPNATVILTARADSVGDGRRDTMMVSWRPIAKDGADLPAAARVSRFARQIVGMGETYDFEYAPARRGILRLEVRPAAGGQMFVRVPIRVE